MDLFLSLCLGDKQHPFKFLIPLTVVHCIVFVTGTIGNLLSKQKQNFLMPKPKGAMFILFVDIPVCYIIVKNPSMRTSTNFFLFSLAVSDLTILFVGEFLIAIIEPAWRGAVTFSIE